MKQYRTAILVFARSEEADRKVFGLGPRADRLAKRAVLVHTLGVADRAREESSADLVVAFDGRVELPAAAIGLEQIGASFEERFVGAIDATFALGYGRIVVIGADTPQLQPEMLLDAIDDESTVVGPSVDGGFYLFSFTRGERELLRGLPWRTDRVLACLVGRLAETGSRFTVLDRLEDLDDSSAAHSQQAVLAELVRATLGVELTNRGGGEAPVSTEAPLSRTTVRELSARGPPASA